MWHMSQIRSDVVVVGAGLVGPVVAILLAKLGCNVRLFERGPDPGQGGRAAGRSVHLVVSERGWNAMRQAGVEAPVRQATIPLKGRIIHSPQGGVAFQPYGNEGQAIYAIERQVLNDLLVGCARREPNVTVAFDHRCADYDPEAGALEFETGAGRVGVRAERVVAADGAFSRVRAALMARGRFDYSQAYLPYGYKELSLPPGPGGDWPLDPGAMHVWPRRSAMLTAFPKPDRGFTAMLVLPLEGPGSFASLADGPAVARFFAEHFADARPLIPGLEEEFFARPASSLVTVRCFPWRDRDRAVLVGDAAHAMVPFFGQGMNAGFEDCVVLARCLAASGGDWGAAFAAYESQRKPDGDAVTDLSLRNFVELSERVGDPQFLLRKRLERRMHELAPETFVPLYQMVAFSDLPYARAKAIAEAQDALVEQIVAAGALEAGWDAPGVDALLRERLSAFAPERAR